MDEPTHRHQFLACPDCGSADIYRSKRRGPKDWLLYHVLLQSPYRCRACDHRFFHHRLAHHRRKELHHHPV